MAVAKPMAKKRMMAKALLMLLFKFYGIIRFGVYASSRLSIHLDSSVGSECSYGVGTVVLVDFPHLFAASLYYVALCPKKIGVEVVAFSSPTSVKMKLSWVSTTLNISPGSPLNL